MTEEKFEIVNYNLLEVLNVQKENVSPTGLTQYQITRFGNTYKDPLIKNKRENFWERVDRFEVVMNDPGMFAISGRYIEETMSKLPKCYEVDEGGDPIEVMADVWEKWETLNIAEMFKDIAKKMLDDGYCIGRRYVVDNQIGYRAYGYFESTPFLWHRVNMPFDPIKHNKIWKYDVFFIPVPQGSNNLNTYNVMEVRDTLFPQDPTMFHFTRGKFNWGIGESRIQPIWDPITKLRKTSHADYHRSSIFPIFEYPEDWDGEEFLPDMIDKLRRVDEIEGLALSKYKNQQTGEITEFPRFWERTFAESPGQAKADATSGGSLLRNAEYARILMALGYSETYFVGSQPGEVTGSKLDLTRDDRVDIREFQHYTRLIKDINLWLLNVGAFEGITPESIEFIQNANYNIMHHLEWTVLENNLAAAEMAEDQAEGEAEDIERQNTAPLAILDIKNNTTILGYKTNVRIPMTPIGGGKLVGVDEGNLLVRFPNYPGAKQGFPRGGTYEYHFGNPFEAQAAYTQIGVGGGSYVWSNLRGKQIGPAYLTGNPTPGGTSASLVDYDIRLGPTPTIQGTGPFAESTQLLEQPATPNITPQVPGIMEGPLTRLTPFEESRTEGFQTSTTPSVFTPGRVADPSSITGSVKTGPGRKRKPGRKGGPSPPPSIVPFNITNSVPDISELSYKRYNALSLEVFGEGIGNKTWQKQRKIQDYLNLHYRLRVNALSVGNVMNFDIPLQYIYNGIPQLEYACKKEFKKIRKHNGDLFLYSNMSHSGRRTVVGDYLYWWDEEKDMPMAKFNYDNEKILALVPEDSIIAQRLNAGLEPEMSTEYYADTKTIDGKLMQYNYRDFVGDNIFQGIAIVNKGNCGPPFCSFEEEAEE